MLNVHPGIKGGHKNFWCPKDRIFANTFAIMNHAKKPKHFLHISCPVLESLFARIEEDMILDHKKAYYSILAK
jgi:hypothetical protein